MAITTIYTYPLTGSQREFTVPFEYLARRFVVLTLIGQDRRELVLATDFRFISKTIVQTTVAWGPADGYERIEIRRDTSATDRLVGFADGSILRASELNISQIQTLHVAEEARNMVADTIAENADGDLDARGRRLVNLADATSPDHAVTLRQEQAWAQSTLGNRNAAEAARVASEQARDVAITQRDQAGTFKNQAESAKTAAESARDQTVSATGAIGDNVAISQSARVGAEAARDTAVVARDQAVVARDQAAAFASALGDLWAFQPIGALIPILTNITGISVPPTDKTYRYIKLTHGDPYNAGAISGEVMTGSGPLVSATGVINFPGSPLNGQEVRLINTEARVLRASVASGSILQDAMQGHGHDTKTGVGGWSGSPAISDGVVSAANVIKSDAGAYKWVGSPISDGINGTPRVSDETRVKSLGVTYFMRIK